MKKKAKFVIVDYGIGNLRSLSRAFEHWGAHTVISEDQREVETADALILPGDGAFGTGMDGLAVRELTASIKTFARQDKPILGICLGAQILFSWGLEFGKFRGLDLIGGKVVKFPKLANGEKIPQIGWNGIFSKQVDRWKGTILNSIPSGSDVYYIHSYIMVPRDKKNILAVSTYGGQEFCSVVKDGKIYGCQFHPEKSGDVGLKIINNFIKLSEK